MLESWRCTEAVEVRFKQKTELHGWGTRVGMGEPLFKERKLGTANEMYKDRWLHYYKYEACNTFYKDAQCVLIGPPDAEDGRLSVWTEVEALINLNSDLTKMTGETNQRVFTIAIDLLRALKNDAPELVPKILLLALPRVGSAWGQCSLCPDGLPVLKKVRCRACSRRCWGVD